MADKRTEDNIKELNNEEKAALVEMQFGIPEGVYSQKIVDNLDSRDLITRFFFTSPRSQISIPGWALSDYGNQVVEELARREREEERRKEGIPEAEAKPTKKEKKGDAN